MKQTKPFNKQNILFLILSILNLGICLFLSLTCVPGQIATAVNFNEKIIATASKWLLSINILLPFILAILMFIFYKKSGVVFALKTIFVFMLYENLLAYSYFCLETNFEIGTLSQIPLSASIFMPISVLLSVLAIKMKYLPFKSKFLGIRTKYTRADEFIWKQTHFLARDVFFATGIILFLTNIVFLFVRLAYIPLAILIVAIVVDLIIINNQSKKMYDKLVVMKARNEKFNSQKPTEEKTENKTEDKPDEKQEENTQQKSQKNNTENKSKTKTKKIRG